MNSELVVVHFVFLGTCQSMRVPLHPFLLKSKSQAKVNSFMNCIM